MKGDFSRSTFSREKHYSSVRMQQGRVQLDADWNEQVDIQAYLNQATRHDVIGPCGAPKQVAGFALRIDPEEGLPVIGKGRYYVDGILCENEQDTLITNQPDLPGSRLPETLDEHGLYLAYLDVWQRHVTALEDADIREVALGGPDTATRTKTVWQVKLERVGNIGADVDCRHFGPARAPSIYPDWLPAGMRSTGMLRARAQGDATGDDPCILPLEARYRRLENQLYRIEIHDGSDSTTGATFKWSRDNGSLVARLEKPIDGKILTVSDPGRGGLLRFAPGQWLEVTDEGRVLRGEPGVLVQLAAVEGKQLTVVEFPGPDGGPPELDLQTTTVRRWDSPGAIPLTTDDYLDLEDGVQVNFLDGHYLNGDYWMIPARTVPGDVLWPVDESSREPLFQAPHGTHHHYCTLALLQFEGTWTVLPGGDCRRLFPALTEPKELETGIQITNLLVKDANNVETPLRNDTEVSVDFLMQGVHIECNRSIDPDTLGQRPTCSITLDMPFPLNSADKELWGNEIIGFQPLILDAEVRAESKPAVESEEELGVIVWTPGEHTAEWLQNNLFQKMADVQQGNRVRARLTLKGNFIWASDQPDLYLNGEVFGIRQPGGTNTDLRLPSGDRTRGGDFEMWFWLVPSLRPAPRIVVEPSIFDFGGIRVGRTASRPLTVRNAGNALLDVKSIAFRRPQREFRITPPDPFTVEPDGQKELTVHFTPGTAGARANALIIASSDPGSPTVTVLLRGIGVAVPHIVVAPLDLNFGVVRVGSRKDLPLTLRNTGGAPLVVTNLSIDNAQSFTAVDRVNGRPLPPTANFRLDPNRHIELAVRFIPRATGVQTGALTIESRDPDNQFVRISLHGRGRRGRIGPVGPVGPIGPV